MNDHNYIEAGKIIASKKINGKVCEIIFENYWDKSRTYNIYGLYANGKRRFGIRKMKDSTELFSNNMFMAFEMKI